MKVIEHRRRRLNSRLLLATLLAITASAAGVHLLHERQARAAAQTLRTRGMAARDGGNHKAAVEELAMYVGFVPDDTDAVEMYADSLSHLGTHPELREQVYALRELVLRRRPERTPLRVKQAQLALELGRVPEASAHVDAVERREEPGPDLWFIRARCRESQRDFEAAAAAYRQVLEQDPERVEATERLANLLAERLDARSEAIELVEDLAQRTGSVESLLLRARWHARIGNREQAVRDLHDVVRREPENAVAATALADAITGASDATDALNRTEALSGLRACVAADPENIRLRLTLVRLLSTESELREEAVAVLATGLELDPANDTLIFALADLLLDLDRVEPARELLDRFGDSRDARQRRLLIQARVLMAEQHFDEALVSLAALSKSVPRDSSLLTRSRMYEARCLQELTQHDAAREVYLRLLERSPESPQARLALAESLLRTGQTYEAISEYRRLTSIPQVNPFLADLLISTAAAGEPAGDWDEVERLLSDEDPLVPGEVERAVLRADMWFVRGDVQRALKELAAANKAHPGNSRAARAFEEATYHVLERILGDLRSRQQRDSTGAAFRTVVSVWSDREEAARLTLCLERFVAGTAVPDEVHARMAMAAFLSAKLAETVPPGDAEAKLLRYADETATRLARLNSSAAVHLAQLAAFAGDADGITEALSACRDEDGFTEAVMNVVPLQYGKHDLLRLTEEHIRARLQLSPDSPRLSEALAVALSARGDHESAIQTLTAIESVSGDRRSRAALLAWLLAVHRGDHEGAGAAIADVTADAGSSPDVQLVLACVEIAAGRYDTARVKLRRLAERHPGPRPFVYLAWCDLMQDDRIEALASVHFLTSAGYSAERLHPLEAAVVRRVLAEARVSK